MVNTTRIISAALVLSILLLMSACNSSSVQNDTTAIEETTLADTTAEETTAAETTGSEETTILESESSGFSADSLIGSYSDKVSERASLEIEKSGKAEMYDISVHWGITGIETEIWSFTCRFNAENNTFECSGLAYCEIKNSNTNESTVVYSDEDATIKVDISSKTLTINDVDGALSECVFEVYN